VWITLQSEFRHCLHRFGAGLYLSRLAPGLQGQRAEKTVAMWSAIDTYGDDLPSSWSAKDPH
jgi:hypothetical protein